ncbi:GNAT family N-acetyltransferase [Roseomonas sp. CCTCC AB2023176]|uniref:GNAT family N-acetyltransferase n=1 Tax=Roseomonas sp. CCTCC AB2023176 TaxID=3342640 RepID=UPI0035DE5CE7
MADAEKEALGFLPAAAYDEAISRNRVIAMLDLSKSPHQLAGFVLFSGVFPNARIQQIAVASEHRQRGVATALLTEVVARHEAQGYLRITAAVADDLLSSQAFYEKNGFVATITRKGGSARDRTIIVRARDLDNDHLLVATDPSSNIRTPAVDLGLRIRGAGLAPLYSMDLNVLFDAIRDGRARAEVAQRVIGAALKHKVRLAVAHEFLVELNRNATPGKEDPILALARHLPRLTATNGEEVVALASRILRIVFGSEPSTGGYTVQAKSDARHLAEAALARASGFLTSDGQVLSARRRLFEEVGIDVLSLDDFALMIDDLSASQGLGSLIPQSDMTWEQVTPALGRAYFEQSVEAARIFMQFQEAQSANLVVEGLKEGNELVGLAARLRHPALDSAAQVLIHVRPDHVRSDLLADALLNSQCEQACINGPVMIELQDLPGQTVLRRTALMHGFMSPERGIMAKVAVGRPITERNWPRISRVIQRRANLRLPDSIFGHDPGYEIAFNNSAGQSVKVTLAGLEKALGPTLFAWPGRLGAIVPIAQHFADELLGTARQASMFSPKEAGISSIKTYVCTPRVAPMLNPEMPILFYESVRSGGRGAVIASARIVDGIIVNKTRLPAQQMRRSVIEDVDSFSSSEEVLVVTFNNVLRFPRPVNLPKLRLIGAVGPNNLVTTTPISSETLVAILEFGWNNV